MADAPSSRTWDGVLVALLLGSVAIVFWHEVAEGELLRSALAYVDAALCALFVVEWAWRGVASGRPVRWGLRHSWELLGMVPLLLPVPSALRVLRLFRLVRILRVFGRVGARLGVWERIASESQLVPIGLVSGSVTVLGALLVWVLERDTNAKLAEFPEALWWAVVTVTTVGYGDITPLTAPGRFVAVLLMITGIGTIGLLASSLASVLVVKREAPPSAPPAMAGGLASELVRLAELRRDGALTEDEYERAKQKLLA